MAEFNIGQVKEIGSSGKAWMGYNSRNIADLLFEELEKAQNSIQISSFSTGNDTDVMNRFFDLLEKKLKDTTFEISMIVNDDGKKNSHNTFAKKKINELKHKKPEQFFSQFFQQTKVGNLNKILHAKLGVIDGTTALIGSANLSKGALESNYEIMLKVTGKVAVDLSQMLHKLSSEIERKTA